MEPWNYNIAEAPHDAPIWGASKCGKVIKTDWIEKRQAWSGFADKSPPVAWVKFEKPIHPDDMPPSSEPNEDTKRAIAAVKAIIAGRHPRDQQSHILVTAEQAVATLLLICMDGPRQAAAMLNEGLVPGVEERLSQYAAMKEQANG